MLKPKRHTSMRPTRAWWPRASRPHISVMTLIRPVRRPSRDNRRRNKGDTVKRNKTAASNEALGIKQPAAKDSHAKPAATPVKSSAAVVKTSAAPAKASVAPAKATAVSPKPKVVAASPTSKSAVPFAPKKAASVSPTPKVTVKQIAVKKEAKPAAAHKTVTAAPKTKNSPPAAASSTTSDSPSAGQDEKASDDDAVKDAQDK